MNVVGTAVQMSLTTWNEQSTANYHHKSII